MFPTKACFGDPFHLSKSSSDNARWIQIQKLEGRRKLHIQPTYQIIVLILWRLQREMEIAARRERERESFPPSGAGEIVENGKYSASASVSVANKNVRTLERTQTHTPRAESFA